MKITFLGTASNGGIPQIGCNCKNCNKSTQTRLRSSVLIRTGRKLFIIDCTPDFRQQILEANISLKDIEGIILTHLHFDHIGGLPELTVGKPLNIPIICHHSLKKSLKENSYFSYIFKNKYAYFTKIIDNNIKLVEVKHSSNFNTFGVIISEKKKSIGYFPDIATVNNRLLKIIKNLSILIWDGTFISKSKFGHLSVNKFLKINKYNERLILTHINHSESTLLYKRLSKKFGFKLAKESCTIILN